MNWFRSPGWWITLPVVLLTVVPQAFTKGMFMDGMMYASLAHNYFTGQGELWKPYFSAEYYPAFYEHPPLVFALHGNLYSLLGDTFYSDKLYAVVVNLLTVLLFHLIWKKVFSDFEQLKRFSWLPVLLWISIPRVFWAYHNNVLDITMGMFSAASVYSLLFVSDKWNRKSMVALIAASFFLLLAFLSKGFVGLFPLSFLFWKDLLVLRQSYSRIAIRSSMLIGIFIVLSAAFFYLNNDAWLNIEMYLQTQVKQSLAGQRETDSRFFIIKTLLSEALLPILVTIVSFVYARWEKIHQNPEVFRLGYLFLALGLSGIIPIMVSPKQLGFYLLPAIPFVVMALSLFIIQNFKLYPLRIALKTKKVLVSISLLMLLALPIASYFMYGYTLRDKELQEDAAKISSIISPAKTVCATNDFLNEWSLMAYLKRYYNVELRFKDCNDVFYLSKSESNSDSSKIVVAQLNRLSVLILNKISD